MKLPTKIYVPVELRKRIEALRNCGGSGGTTYPEYAIALLELAVTSYEATAEAMDWGDDIKVVPDPTLEQDHVRIIDNNSGVEHTLKITESEDGKEIAAVNKDGSVQLRMAYDTKTGEYTVLSVKT